MAGSNVDTSELRLLDEAAAGDREARRVLFERYRDAAYRVALRISGREEDALDIVQDGFIKAFERLGGFRGRQGEATAVDENSKQINAAAGALPASSFKTWLLRIVTNRALDALRARKVRLAVSIDGDDESRAADTMPAADDEPPGAEMERTEMVSRLEQAIESLSPDQKSVFSLYASGEMTYGQIAEVVGIPVGTVMSRIFHARRRLHEKLGDLAPRGAIGTADEGG